MIGKLKEEMIEAVFDTLPVEFSVLDKDDNVAGWNKHETRIFKRPASVVGKNVRNCHPQKSLEKVEQILYDLKAGKKVRLPFGLICS